MKILLVSWSILPQSGGTSVIIENLAKNFSKDEMIVLGAKTLFQNNDIDRNPKQATFRYFFSEMYLFGRGYRYFIWFRKWRHRPLVNHIKKIIKEEKIDHVIGVYPNPFYCLAACQAAKDMGIPFSSYFHNTYTENVAITDPNAEAIQAEIFDYSRHIFVMSKGMQRFYEKKYQLKKFIPLVHTFDEYPKNTPLTGIPKTDKKHYKLVAIGNFNESNLDATKRFLEAIKNHPQFSLSVYTHVPKLLLQKRGLDTFLFEHKGSVAPEEIHDILQAYDICVLTHGFTGGYGEVEYQTIFPTRTIPFLLSGKPIIAHSPKGSFLNQFIKENNCAALVDEASETAIIKALENLCKNEKYQQELVDAAQKTSEQFYGPNVANFLKKTLSINSPS
jgi:glycosyltransferase involved in cell wall biosynthesis